MGLYSWANDKSLTFQQMLDQSGKAGPRSDSSFDTMDVEKGTDVLLDFMEKTGTSLTTAMKMMNDSGMKPREEELYAGRLLRRLENQPDGEQLMQKYGLPSLKVVKEMGTPDDWSIGNMSGTLNRFIRGGQQEMAQIMYGAGKGEEWLRNKGEEAMYSVLPDWWKDKIDAVPGDLGKYAQERVEVQKGRKQFIADSKYDENVWKSYNAELDPETSTGLNLPWNVGGAFGEGVPGMAAGGLAGTAIRGAGQPLAAFGVNSLLEGAKYQEHDNAQEAIVGTAMGLADFVPFAKMLSLNPVSKGMRLKNWATAPGTNEMMMNNKNLTRSSADRAYNAAKMLESNNLFVPFSMANAPKSTAQKLANETREVPIKQMGDLLSKVKSSASLAYEQGLDAIGPAYNSFKGAVPKGHQSAPLGYALRNQIIQLKKRFSDKAQPFITASENAGKKIKLDTQDMMDMATGSIKSPKALSAFNTSLKSVTGRESKYSKETKELMAELLKSKDKMSAFNAEHVLQEPFNKTTLDNLRADFSNIQQSIMDLPEGATQLSADKLATQLEKKRNQIGKSQLKYDTDVATYNQNAQQLVEGDVKMQEIEDTGGMLDLDNLTAYELSELVKEVNSRAYSTVQTRDGLEETEKYQLKQWGKQARKLLGDPEKTSQAFAVPFNKAKALQAQSLELFGDSSIPGLGKAMTQQDGVGGNIALEKLFTGTGSENNLAQLGGFLKSDDATFRGLVRKNIEDKVTPDVQGISGVGGSHVDFDLEKFAQNTEGVDWDVYRAMMGPGGRAGIDNLSGLGGLNDTMLKGQFDNLKGAMDKTPDLSMAEVTPIRDTLDQMRVYTKLSDQPYYRYSLNEPNIREKIGMELEKSRPPEVVGGRYQGPGRAKKVYGSILEQLRESEGVGNLPQNAEGLDILSDPKFDLGAW